MAEEPIIDSSLIVSDEELMEVARRQIFDPDILLHNFDNNPDGIVVVCDGKIEKVNNRAQLLTGYHKSELIGQNIEMLVPSSKREDHVKHRGSFENNPRMRSMGTAGLEIELQRKDGRNVPVEVNLHPVQTRRGLKVLATIRPRDKK